MKCNACDYDDEKEIGVNEDQDDIVPHPFIELEPLMTRDIGWYDSSTRLHTVFACPRCGTLKIDTGQ